MSNKNKYGGKAGGTKRRRKQYSAKHGETEFSMQPPVRRQNKKLETKTDSQREYVRIIDGYDIIFADGPAGCGKTFVATALGLQGVLVGKYERLVITRPVMEAGEKLGFLPGKASEKIRPYIEPIYDTLKHFIGLAEIQTLINRGQIEIAPLAYMRGRTFDDSFIIVDEAQNCTLKQLKMAITRIGQNSKIIVNGDITQSDWEEQLLENAGLNALKRHIEVFENIDHPKIKVYRFNPLEIVRNSLIGEYLQILEGNRNADTN